MPRSLLPPRALAPLLAGVVLAVPACHTPREPAPRVVRIAGSDTMLLLTQRWAEAFMRLHPEVVVHVQGGGTGSGVEQLLRGHADLCAGSRPLMSEEVRQIYQRYQTLGVSFRCAKDAIGIYLNPANPVRDLTLLDLEGIFAGRIRRWDELGGISSPIEPLVRQPNSGSYRLFQELVLADRPYTPDATTLPTTRAIVDAVRDRPEAVGYGGLAYGDPGLFSRVDGIEPTPDNVRSGRYPLARYLYLHALRPPRGWSRSFIDWTLSAEGQALALAAGYEPLWEAP